MPVETRLKIVTEPLTHVSNKSLVIKMLTFSTNLLSIQTLYSFSKGEGTFGNWRLEKWLMGWTGHSYDKRKERAKVAIFINGSGNAIPFFKFIMKILGMYYSLFPPSLYVLRANNRFLVIGTVTCINYHFIWARECFLWCISQLIWGFSCRTNRSGKLFLCWYLLWILYSLKFHNSISVLCYSWVLTCFFLGMNDRPWSRRLVYF